MESPLERVTQTCTRLGIKPAARLLVVRLATQTLQFYRERQLVQSYPVSTSRRPPSNVKDSRGTPRGLQEIAERIGEGQPPGMVFKSRVPTGRHYSELPGGRDRRQPHHHAHPVAARPRAGPQPRRGRRHLRALRLHPRHQPRGPAGRAPERRLRAHAEPGHPRALRPGPDHGPGAHRGLAAGPPETAGGTRRRRNRPPPTGSGRTAGGGNSGRRSGCCPRGRPRRPPAAPRRRPSRSPSQSPRPARSSGSAG